ncbi:PREDICTED: pecanex-like protein 1 isoform X1 [Amphimedon queenslandica]|uniref:Pecanex-like protein n=1 Tax=Amphimedon queenslandica TaxID=400682 RepID=A0A1X7TMJ2_AMPQE|nr:PREDICTED: pecanex-like protein 1 isoform X1 [Amphimedon queenslandica]|eukprot:XP_019858793.1 PREDICTED: pecanex-like protein 1 isoform X1 [Amphimedon queenslandica]
MGLEEIGNVIYFGFFASFFGGWVPVRAKNLKLAVFHLYLFVTMLIFPLIIYIVDSTRIAGWVVYGFITAISFILLKVTNYRLHKALGSDPPPESETPSSVDEQETNDDTKEDAKKEETTENKQEEEEEEEDNASVIIKDGAEGGEKMAEVARLERLPTSDDDSRHQLSASTLNDGSSLQYNNMSTPEVELSQVSQPCIEEKKEEKQSSEGVVDDDIKPYESSNEDHTSIGSRQRVCQRSLRQDSSRGRREREETLQEVSNVLSQTPYSELSQVVNKMPTRVHEAILSGVVTDEEYRSLVSRIGELRRGKHLAVDTEDFSPGSIHWIDGQIDFYVFDNETEDEDFTAMLRDLMRNDFESYPTFFQTPPTPPVVPPKPKKPDIDDHAQNDDSSLPTPYILLLPRIAKTKVTLNFTRRQLEDYMDRNVSITEVVIAITLSVLVCVIGALLLTIPEYYNGFWVFALCFVIATTHFSLIKSVQSDPASPSPGQNRINAMGRAFYFIFVGILALLFDVILRNTGSYTPACIYHFNYNNPELITFIRDGLFIFILLLPILFTLGWMPQCDTFLINALEHIDIHIFGGTASTGLICSAYGMVRNLFAVACLLPLGYAAFVSLENDPGYIGSDCSVTFSSYRKSEDLLILSQQCTNSGRVALSFFLGGVVMASYALSRSTTNHQYILDLALMCLKKVWDKLRHTHHSAPPTIDPLDQMYRKIMCKRLLVDAAVGLLLLVTVTILNLTTLFCQTEVLAYVVYGITGVLGIINHYLLPHLRKETPYLCFTKPCITSDEYNQFEVTEQPKVSLVEQLLQVSLFLEKNVFYPLCFLFGINITAVYYRAKFGEIGAALVVSVVGMKLFRTAYSELSRQHAILILSLLFFNFDYAHLNEGFPINYFVAAILFSKVYELYLKVYFILIYIMPGSWSSPFHIVIQPLLIPHCPLIFFETLIGTMINAPMNPVIASSMFFLSYARPIKFWEKDYNTKRRDTSNTRLEQQLETNIRNPNPDHLDSLFYEQLSWSLQRDLCGDIMLGRWGRVTSGDFFILTNDQLNALVHIIEIGNGFVTFQLRGLEFRGTYCHQREREAIAEPFSDDEGCCCCRLPYTLACNKALCARWMAWEVISSSYTLHGYSISENQAHLAFNAFDYKKMFVTYYVKCIIYYLFKYPQLLELLSNEQLQESLALLTDPDSSDLDPLFDQHRNIDYSSTSGGISRRNFVTSHYDFILTCVRKSSIGATEIDTSEESFLVTLCFAYSLLGRRLFFTHANTGSGRRGDNFMHGLYRMFLGDARPNGEKDEWIFIDVDSIQQVIIPAVRTALKVHQDSFTFTAGETEASEAIYDAIIDTDNNHLVTHENDRIWRDGVFLNRPSLLALRYQRTEDSYVHPYKIIRLTSKFIKFRVVKVNRECVRSLWSSQQHELIFLRNSDSERGSIQNHKASLRNMINSSMDLPIGYPIYVSPLQTSFLERHAPFNESKIGQASNPGKYWEYLKKFYQKFCTESPRTRRNRRSKVTSSLASADSLTGVVRRTSDGPSNVHTLDEGRPHAANIDDDSDSDDDFWKPIWIGKQVAIVNEDEIFNSFNENWLQWPDKSWPGKATPTSWAGWKPCKGMTGEVIHEWRPFHVTSTSRSHIDKVILLIKVADNLVLIKEQGVHEV